MTPTPAKEPRQLKPATAKEAIDYVKRVCEDINSDLDNHPNENVIYISRAYLNSLLSNLTTIQSALESSASPTSATLKATLDEIRGAVERESYWCEDCQLEYPKEGFEPSMHSEHEVVPITVIAGWWQAKISDSALTASASEARERA